MVRPAIVFHTSHNLAQLCPSLEIGKKPTRQGATHTDRPSLPSIIATNLRRLGMLTLKNWYCGGVFFWQIAERESADVAWEILTQLSLSRASPQSPRRRRRRLLKVTLRSILDPRQSESRIKFRSSVIFPNQIRNWDRSALTNLLLYFKSDSDSLPFLFPSQLSRCLQIIVTQKLLMPFHRIFHRMRNEPNRRRSFRSFVRRDGEVPSQK